MLPNLVKFCEICESRDQIKWIKDRTLRLQDQIAMDDTISHEVGEYVKRSKLTARLRLRKIILIITIVKYKVET